MDGISALFANLDGLSLVIGGFVGLGLGFAFVLLTKRQLQQSFAEALEAQKTAFTSLSADALKETQETLLNLANDKSEAQTKAHSAELESKKELIDQQLEHMSETLKTVPTELGKSQDKVNEVLQQSTQSLKESNESYLKQLDDKSEAQTKAHIAELEEKKKLIDQHLQQMSETLKTVPTELEKSQDRVSETLEKSTEALKQSSQEHLTQLSEKADAQTKAHQKELEGKKELIDQRLTDMDQKLGKVERLVSELQTDRKAQYGALDEQLKSLTSTTTSLQKALADNRARGQWGERMADDMLRFMGMVEGVNYIKQATLEGGTRPDFTFLLPNAKTLNMDVKFPLDNYTNYFDAESDADKRRYSRLFLNDVNARISEIHKRGYIAAQTLDCVLIFIPNEQIYRFIHEQDQSVIDNALRQKVILCSPLTLYIVLAVIRQAAQNFNIEQRSRDIVEVVNEIRDQWEKYTGLMDGMSKNFNTLQNKFNELTGPRRRSLDKRFSRIETVMENGSVEISKPAERQPVLSPTTQGRDELPF